MSMIDMSDLPEIERKAKEKSECIKMSDVAANWAELRLMSDMMRNRQDIITKDSPNNFANVIADNIWKGQRCFIIGGGESLKTFDWRLLKGELTIGVNMSFMKISPSILFSTDSRFYEWIIQGALGDYVKKKFADYKGFKVWLNFFKYRYPDAVYQVDSAGEKALTTSIKEGIGHGSNSGYAALNLAMCLGANPIYLLGFDMKGDGNGKQAWWHDGYPLNQGDTIFKHMIENFNKASLEIKERGFKVINLSEESALKCFDCKRARDIKKIERPIIVSFYTKNTSYEKEIKNLERSIKKFGFEYDLQGVVSKGNWRENTYHKAVFMREMLDKHEGRDVAWLDSDAAIQKYPDRFNNFKADIGIHIIDWSKYRNSTKEQYGNAVIYLKNNQRTKNFLDKWIIKNKNTEHCDCGEEVNFGEVLKEMVAKNEITLEEFDASYSQIFDLMKAAGEPTVELFQASRRFKNEN